MHRILFVALAFSLLAIPASAQNNGAQPAQTTAAAPATTAPATAPAAKPATTKPKPKQPAAPPAEPLTSKQKNAAAVASFLLVTLAVIAFAFLSEVLRDADPASFVDRLGPGDVMADRRKTYRRSFSLSQSQMMWWFWIVLSSYVYIAWKTWDVGGGLTEQALTLTGIGIGTAVGAAIIDQNKKDKAGPFKDLNDATIAIKDPATDPAELPALYKKLNEAADRLKSTNFLADILSDMNGISMHRFQSLAWTVVIGIAFLINVFTANKMPELNGFQLTLLGISAGTYLGLKIPEKP